MMTHSTVHKKHFDPDAVPKWILQGGSRIPCMGLGTFGSDSVPAAKVAETVRDAIHAGYRHIDCASVYGNEKNIGHALQETFRSGFVKREELWIT